MQRHPIISKTEINWIVNALQNNIVSVRDDMENCEENSPIWSLGEITIQNLEDLITKLNDIANSGCKSVRIA